MKRFLCLICALSLLLPFFIQPVGAANEVFIATNNMILPLSDAMPIKSGGSWYVDYKALTSGDLKVSSSYNADSKTLVLYTWDTTLVFNLSDNTAYNTKDNQKISQRVLSSHGTYYVPAEFVAKQLGIKYSYIESASCIRFCSSSNLSDEMFGYIVKSKIPELIAQYNSSKENESNPPPQNAPSTDEDVTVQKRVYLTFSIKDGKNLSAILDQLKRYKMPATFFMTESSIKENDNAARQILIDGHGVGITANSNNAQAFSNPEAMLTELSRANNMLYNTTRTKTRLVQVPGGSKANLTKDCANVLVQSGYRFWDWTIDADGQRQNPSSSYISNTVINSLTKRNYAIIRLSDSDQTLSALARILRYLADNKCVVSSISELDSPTNQHNDNR